MVVQQPRDAGRDHRHDVDPGTREERDRSRRRMRYWAVMFALVLAFGGAIYGYSWAEIDATAQGAGAGTARQAALVVAVAALLAVLALSLLVGVALIRVPARVRRPLLGVAAAIALLVVAVVLFVVVYPMLI